MKDLDKKLIVLLDQGGHEKCKHTKKAIAQIKQAFQEEEYIQLGGKMESANVVTDASSRELPGWLWYERFVKECNKLRTPMFTVEAIELLYETAAKRASGIEGATTGGENE